ncbi:hypothetical protein O6H91_05G022600 [Diphasiastrum complanatum]|uniref:Uncharacterized protein n=1 Tax=Diphasiastrum complanatum TaxID=34168 RepID=A0ACC2DLM8_DIPCM|nr:hypothetical protein O6H91_05G022600 [Diphasiastrum complanatum]
MSLQWSKRLLKLVFSNSQTSNDDLKSSMDASTTHVASDIYCPTTSKMNEGATATTHLLHKHRVSEADAISDVLDHEDLNKQNNGQILPASDSTSRKYQRLMSNPRDEFRRFRECLFWMGLDQSTPMRICCSWIIFFLLVLGVPLLNIAFVICPDCDEQHQHPFERQVLYSESALATVSFLCLSYLLRHYGLRTVLLLDNITRESKEIQQGYKCMVDSSFRLLGSIVLPTLLVELAHKIWWFAYASVDLPLIPYDIPDRVIMCGGMVISWLYKTSVYLLMCVLFRLSCSLQILRLQSYDKLLEETHEVSVILTAHMRIRRKLSVISHRSRLFILSSLITITLSQFSSLFLILSSSGAVDFFRAGGLAVCSAIQLTGFVICLSGAAKITHKAQKIVSIVSQWHAVATCSSYAGSVPTWNSKQSPSTEPISISTLSPAPPLLNVWEPEDDLEAAMVKVSVHQGLVETDDSTAYRRRQSFVTYLQNNNAGVSLYGFVLDRGLLYTIFCLELSLVLWIMGKTVGIH